MFKDSSAESIGKQPKRGCLQDPKPENLPVVVLSEWGTLTQNRYINRGLPTSGEDERHLSMHRCTEHPWRQSRQMDGSIFPCRLQENKHSWPDDQHHVIQDSSDPDKALVGRVVPINVFVSRCFSARTLLASYGETNYECYN